MAKPEEDKCQYLYMGKKSGTGATSETFQIAPKSLLSHAAIIGQSGSGKSFALGRLIEEIILQTKGKVFIFDSNSDFVNIQEPEQAVWNDNNDYLLIQENHYDTNYNDFVSKWNSETHLTKILQSDPHGQENLLISWERLDEKELRQLLNLDPTEHPDAVALLKQIYQYAKHNGWQFKHWEAISRLLIKWARNVFETSVSEVEFEEKFARFISITTSIETAQLIATALDDAISYPIWDRGQKQNILNMILPYPNSESGQPIEKLPRITCINLDSLRGKTLRLFVARHVMERLWSVAGRSRWQIISEGRSKDQRTPVFIVVDEAHRLAPRKTEDFAEKQVLELFRQVAAEGRKYGLFLILATQRPTKLHQDILSECDNLCVMKLVSPNDQETVGKSMGYKEDDYSRFKSFKQGQATFYGKWAEDWPVEVERVAAQRTKPGGANIPMANFCIGLDKA